MSVAVSERMVSIAAYPVLPGHSVFPTSRWANRASTVAVCPLANFDVPPPAEVSVTFWDGSRYVPPSFHAARRSTEVSSAGVGAVVLRLPIIAIPKVSRLKPPACAATTGRSIPPARPSKIVPYLSTRAL